MDCSLPGTSVRGIFPGKNTGMGSHFLLQGIFLTQGSNLGLLHCRQIHYRLSQQGSPAWVLKCSQILLQSSQPEGLWKRGGGWGGCVEQEASFSGHYSLLKLQIIPLKLTQLYSLKMYINLQIKESLGNKQRLYTFFDIKKKLEEPSTPALLKPFNFILEVGSEGTQPYIHMYGGGPFL